MYPPSSNDQITYPLTLEATVLELDHGIADLDDREYLQKKLGENLRFIEHLPDGAPYGLVEIDMQGLVSEAVYRKFEKQLSQRERTRKKRQEREEMYAGKIEKIQDEKFEKIKREAIHAVNTESVFLKP
jgi:hypothetical protein